MKTMNECYFPLGVFPVNMKKMIGHDFKLMHVVE